jgi:tungstate transport system substrate-binding protein
MKEWQNASDMGHRTPAWLVLIAVFAASCSSAPPSRRIALATTTSVDNSGLLNSLLPSFRAQTHIDVQVVTPGSGIALDMLARGDVDVAISHAPAREAQLLRDSGAWYYRKIMFNDFVVVGPPGDPAHARDASVAIDAMRRIAESGVRFISRGDSSGTHERERELWAKAGIVPGPEQVVIAGSGMGATLRIAETMRAYTLTDRATFAPFAERGELKIAFEGGPDMLNTYAVITRREAPAGPREFAVWLADGEGRRAITSFRTASGAPAFTVWPDDCPRESPSAIPCGSATGGQGFNPDLLTSCLYSQVLLLALRDEAVFIPTASFVVPAQHFLQFASEEAHACGNPVWQWLVQQPFG